MTGKMKKKNQGTTSTNGKGKPKKKAGTPINIKTASNPPYLVCIGASAGGLDAVSELISGFTSSLNAAVFIVLHLSKSAIGEILIHRIKKQSPLPCYLAEHKRKIKPGEIYVAPPDAHLLAKTDHMVIGHGPAENRFRPSIDVLFRSAAVSHGPKAIGVVLTGFLNDGTSGMWAIKQSGGHTLVQDPNEAEYPDMPLSVLESIEVDYSLPLKAMANVIVQIIKDNQVKSAISAPEKIIAESLLSEKMATRIESLDEVGESSLFSCPDCSGRLWKVINGKLTHYRCHVGHSYSEKDLVLRQSEATEATLWVALRMMEERNTLLKRISRENKERGLHKISQSYSEQVEQLQWHIDTLKALLLGKKHS